jgi:HSP20 family protein
VVERSLNKAGSTAITPTNQTTIHSLKNYTTMLVRFSHPMSKLGKTFADDFFTRDFDKMFQRFEGKTTLPAVNIKETEDGFEVALSVPGFKKEDFNLKLENDRLTISAKVEENKEEKSEKYSLREFKQHAFSRSFTLPEHILTEEINAKYEDGILKVAIPKNKVVLEKKAKEIVIA